MEELWKVSCSESDKEKWTKEVQLSTQDMVELLRMLLCRKLAPDEIIESVTGKRPDLLEVRSEENGDLWTPQAGLLHYTARKMSRP